MSVTSRIAATSLLFAVGVCGIAISPMLALPPLHGFIVRCSLHGCFASDAPPRFASPPSF
jgi:hypothetical protein